MNNNPTYPWTVSGKGNKWQVWNISTGWTYMCVHSIKLAHKMASDLAELDRKYPKAAQDNIPPDHSMSGQAGYIPTTIRR